MALLASATLAAAEAAGDANAVGGPDANGPDRPLRIVFFYSETCQYCQWAKDAVSAATARWGDQLAVENHNLADMDSHRLMFRYEGHYGADEQAALKLFAGQEYLAGGQAIADRLAEVVRRQLETGAVTFEPGPLPPAADEADRPVAEEVVARFRGFSAAAVAVAGLLDGVNPCAFATIVFLLSMLAVLGKTGRDLAIVGAGFTAAVFATYLALGLGLLGAIKAFSVSAGISRGITIGVGVFTLALAAWSFVDFVRYSLTRDVKTVTLGLPESVKARIRAAIRAGLSTRRLWLGSITLGITVALLESLCTGQVYLPTITFVLRDPALRTHALLYLLLYNLMFILPLVVFLAIGYMGTSALRVSGFLRTHLATLKLAMALLFAGLGILVLSTV
jgi:hypothetical protein